MSEDNCWKCANRLEEECGYDGHEVYPYTESCYNFTNICESCYQTSCSNCEFGEGE